MLDHHLRREGSSDGVVQACRGGLIVDRGIIHRQDGIVALGNPWNGALLASCVTGPFRSLNSLLSEEAEIEYCNPRHPAVILCWLSSLARF